MLYLFIFTIAILYIFLGIKVFPDLSLQQSYYTMSLTGILSALSSIATGLIIFDLQTKKEEKYLKNREKSELNVYFACLSNMLANYSGCLASYENLHGEFKLENNIQKLDVTYVYKGLESVAKNSKELYVQILELRTNIDRSIEKLSTYLSNNNLNFRYQGERQFMVNCAELYGQIKSVNDYSKKYFNEELMDAEFSKKIDAFKTSIDTEATDLVNRIKGANKDPEKDPTWDNQNMINNINASYEKWVLPFK